MASSVPVTWSSFLVNAASLPSIPLFAGYMLMIAGSGLWQRRTKPFGLKSLLIVHNFGCCLASFVTLGGFSFSLVHNGSLYGKTAGAILHQSFNLYWISKVVELLDTVFMVLRHRSRQISFLHVYHHASMLLLSDMARLFYTWPSIATFLAINSAVHVILYLYYGLTALHPNDPPKWKKAVTQIQILQFLVGFLIAEYGRRHHGFCIYILFYEITMIVLFANFYFRAYIKKKQSAKGDKTS